MIKKNYAIDEFCELTKLSYEDIEKLKEELK